MSHTSGVYPLLERFSKMNGWTDWSASDEYSRHDSLWMSAEPVGEERAHRGFGRLGSALASNGGFPVAV